MEKKSISKFSKIGARVTTIIESAGSKKIVLEDDLYSALCIGITYMPDQVTTFEGVEKTNDKVSYIFQIPSDEGAVQLQKDFTVSGFDKSNIYKMLQKFELSVNEFYELIGEQLRVNVETKTSAKGNEYNFISSITKAKKNQDDITLDGELELPYWFGQTRDGDNIDTDLIDLIDGVTIGVEKTTDKPDRKLKKAVAEEVADDVLDVDEEVIIEDDSDDAFFDELN